jgi:hypothetical protein
VEQSDCLQQFSVHTSSSELANRRVRGCLDTRPPAACSGAVAGEQNATNAEDKSAEAVATPLKPFHVTNYNSLTAQTLASSARDASQSISVVAAMDAVTLQCSKHSASVTDYSADTVCECWDAPLTPAATSAQARSLGAANKVRSHLIIYVLRNTLEIQFENSQRKF